MKFFDRVLFLFLYFWCLNKRETSTLENSLFCYIIVLLDEYIRNISKIVKHIITKNIVRIDITKILQFGKLKALLDVVRKLSNMNIVAIKKIYFIILSIKIFDDLRKIKILQKNQTVKWENVFGDYHLLK